MGGGEFGSYRNDKRRKRVRMCGDGWSGMDVPVCFLL